MSCPSNNYWFGKGQEPDLVNRDRVISGHNLVRSMNFKIKYLQKHEYPQKHEYIRYDDHIYMSPSSPSWEDLSVNSFMHFLQYSWFYQTPCANILNLASTNISKTHYLFPNNVWTIYQSWDFNASLILYFITLKSPYKFLLYPYLTNCSSGTCQVFFDVEEQKIFSLYIYGRCKIRLWV